MPPFEDSYKEFFFFLCITGYLNGFDGSFLFPTIGVGKPPWHSSAFSASCSVWSVLANCKWLTTGVAESLQEPWLSLVEIQSVNRLIRLSKKVKRLKCPVYLSLHLMQFIIKNVQHLYISSAVIKLKTISLDFCSSLLPYCGGRMGPANLTWVFCYSRVSSTGAIRPHEKYSCAHWSPANTLCLWGKLP